MAYSPTSRVRRDNRKLLFSSVPRSSSAFVASREKNLVQNLSPEPGQDADKFLRPVVSACASSVAVLNEHGTMLYASKAWHLFAKATRAGSRRPDRSHDYFENCVRFAEQYGDEKTNATLSDDIQRILSGEETEFHHRYCYYNLDEPRYIVTHAARLDMPGLAFRVLVNHDDIVIAKEELKKSEERLSQLLETTRILVWEADPVTWRFSYVSKQAVEMLGYPMAKWYRPDFLSSHIHRKDEQRVLSFFKRLPRPSGNHELTFRILARDGRVVWVQNLINISNENGKAVRMRGFMIDISERKRTEEALKELSGRLIAAQEEERRRVARELHDDLNNKMALLSIELEQLAQESQNILHLRPRFRKLQKHAYEIAADIHRLSHKLHPSKLDHLGLAAAVKNLCEQSSESGGLKVKLKQTGFPATLSNDVTLCAFRVVQEALRNCTKHSGAQTARVVLEKTDDSLHLSVSDNGRGFDANADAMKKGLGFVSMKERLHLVGGGLQIHSSPRQGTTIKVLIPLDRELDLVEC